MQFRFVRLDVDLYQPTLDSFEFLHPRMVPGGTVSCDDYAFTICPGTRRSFDEFISGRSEYSVVKIPTPPRPGIRREPIA